MAKWIGMILIFIFSSFCIFAQELWHMQFSAPLGTGARAFGMGGAFIAVADDATAVTWNPGGLGQIESIEISLVGSSYGYEIKYPAITMGPEQRGMVYESGDSSTYELIGVSIPIRPFEESSFKMVFQYSYQRLTPLQIDSSSRPTSFENRTTEFLMKGTTYSEKDYSGGADSHTVSLAVEPVPWLDVGVSLVMLTNGFSGQQLDHYDYDIINLQTGEKSHVTEVLEPLTVEIDFRGTSLFFGALVKLTDYLKLGAVFRKPFVIEQFIERVKWSETHYPGAYGIGISYRPIDQLVLATDFTFSQWSNGKNVWVLDDSEYYFPLWDLPYKEDTEYKFQRQHDTHQIRFGAEYVFIEGDWLIPVRVGAFFDKQLFADYNEETPTYIGITCGVGIVWDYFAFDVAVLYEFGDYKEDPNSAYNTDFNFYRAYASLIFRF